MTEGKTLAELDVKPGDVVRFHTSPSIIGEWNHEQSSWGVYGDQGIWLLDSPDYHIVARADEREDAEDNRTCDERADGPFVKVDIDKPDKPKTWGEMTDAEKGALLLAWQTGGVIEFWNEEELWWEITDCHPQEFEADAYRIRIEPVRETLSQAYGVYGGVPFWGRCTFAHCQPTHRITFDTIDGKPDCNSIRMEVIGNE